MKRQILVFLLGSIVSCTFGQFYVQPSAGYNFSSHPTEYHSTLIINNIKSVYKIKQKYGEGVNLSLHVGYRLNNFLIEVNTQKSVYSKYHISTVQPDLQSLTNFYASGYFGEIDYESSIFQIAPVVGYQIQKNKISSYLKLGPNFMKSTINQTNKYIVWEFEDWDLYPLNIVEKFEYTGTLHVGLQADLGLSYSFRPNLQFVLDFVTVYNNYKITKAEINHYEIDGVSYLEDLDDTNMDIDKDNNKLNHSNYGIHVGIKYSFIKN